MSDIAQHGNNNTNPDIRNNGESKADQEGCCVGRRDEASEYTYADELWMSLVGHWRKYQVHCFTNELVEHIKELLQQARDKATANYGRLVQAIREDSNVSGCTYKIGEKARATGETTYLCLQCSNVSKTRERHRKEHPFCEYSLYHTWT